MPAGTPPALPPSVPRTRKTYMPQQLVKGMYSEFLDGWLSVFPRDRFLFMRTEDYKAAPVEHVTAAIKFLGERLGARTGVAVLREGTWRARNDASARDHGRTGREGGTAAPTRLRTAPAR